MTLSARSIEDLSKEDLEGLRDVGIPEDMTIEYKREPYGSSDAEKKEFCG